MHVSGISWQMIIKDIRGNIQFYVLKSQKKSRSGSFSVQIRHKQKVAKQNYREIKLVFDKTVTYLCVIPTKCNVKRTLVDPCYVVIADSLQFYLNQSLKLFQS